MPIVFAPEVSSARSRAQLTHPLNPVQARHCRSIRLSLNISISMISVVRCRSSKIQHKLMQAMIERDRRYMLGAAGPRAVPPHRVLHDAENRS